MVVLSDALSFDVKPERYPYFSTHPCAGLQCPPAFGFGVLGSVYTTAVAMPFLVILGCWLGSVIRSAWFSIRDDGFEPLHRSSSRSSVGSSHDAEHTEVLEQEAQRWAAERSLRSPETQRMHEDDGDDDEDDTTNDKQDAQEEDAQEEGSADEQLEVEEEGRTGCLRWDSWKLDHPDSIQARHGLHSILPSWCVVVPGAEITKAHRWRCAGMIYQFCWLPICRAALAVTLPRSSPWEDTDETLLLQGDPSVVFLGSTQAVCAWVFGALVLMCLGLGVPDMVVCWNCWRAQPGHDTDDAIHPAREQHPALLLDLYRPGWSGAVWFLLDVTRKCAVVICALAADGSSTPFNLPRWYVPGQTPTVTMLLLSLVSLAVGQPFRHRRHQGFEALSLAALILVAQTADSTFAGWATLSLTVLTIVDIYKRHREFGGGPSPVKLLLMDACKKARWSREEESATAEKKQKKKKQKKQKKQEYACVDETGDDTLEEGVMERPEGADERVDGVAGAGAYSASV